MGGRQAAWPWEPILAEGGALNGIPRPWCGVRPLPAQLPVKVPPSPNSAHCSPKGL